MSERWQIEGLSSAYWLATPRALTADEFPRGTTLTPEMAAAFLDEWFPEGPSEDARAALLADICTDARADLGMDDAPPSVARLKAAIVEALHDGRLVAIRIKATTPAHRRVEAQVEGEPKKPEVVTHWVEFVIVDQNDKPAAGIKYLLTLPSKSTEPGTLPDNGTLHKTGVKKGQYQLELFTVTDAAWGAVEVKVGEAVTLTARVSGFKEGADGSFEVHDATGFPGAAAHTVAGKVKYGVGALVLEATWTPAIEQLGAVTSGKLGFTAVVDTCRATSPPAPVLVKHVIHLVDEKGDLADDTAVTARFTGGARRPGTVAGGAGIVEVWAPLGEKLDWVKVDSRLGARGKLVRQGGTTTEYIAPQQVKV